LSSRTGAEQPGQDAGENLAEPIRRIGRRIGWRRGRIRQKLTEARVLTGGQRFLKVGSTALSRGIAA
jgi:hypothetical protein